MRKYIGTRTISKKTKNRNRSRLRKLPIMPGLEQQHPRQVPLVVVVRIDADDDQREQHAGQHDEEQRDAVDAEVPRDAPRLDPRVLADELEAGVGRVERRQRPDASARRSARWPDSAASLIHSGRRLDSSVTSSAPDGRDDARACVRIGKLHQRIPRTTTNHTEQQHDARRRARQRSGARMPLCALRASPRCAAHQPTDAVDRAVDDVARRTTPTRRSPCGRGRP